MKKQFELIIIYPDSTVTVQIFDNSPDLEILQEAVGGGLIEGVLCKQVYEGRRADIWCNEEGLLKGMPLNKRASVIFGTPIVGPVAIKRVKQDDNHS